MHFPALVRTIVLSSVGGARSVIAEASDASFSSIPGVSSLPAWATTIPSSDFSVAFIDVAAAAQATLSTGRQVDAFNVGEPGHGVCQNTANVFGKTCGFCTDDCFRLQALLESRVVPPHEADVVIVSPELSHDKVPEIQSTRTSLVAALPRRPPGKFYFVHKVSRGLAPYDDCGRQQQHALLGELSGNANAQHRQDQSDLGTPAPIPDPKSASVQNVTARSARTPSGGSDNITADSSDSFELSEFCELLFRPDMIFADIDLGEHDLDDDFVGGRLNGVTLPTGGWTDRHQFRGDVMKRFGSPVDGLDVGGGGGLETTPDLVAPAASHSISNTTTATLSPAGGSSSLSSLSSPSSASPRYLVWFRGKCHGGARSKCKFFPERCTPQELANAQRHGGKVSKARYELSIAFNGSSSSSHGHATSAASSSSSGSSSGSGGGGSGIGEDGGGDALAEEVRLEWVGKLNECPGIAQADTSGGGGGASGGGGGGGVSGGKSGRGGGRNGSSGSKGSGALASVHVTEDEGEAHGPEGEANYFDAMMDAWFTLCPHGDQRWNLRFLEALSAGSIPVVIADGLTLPFSQLIPWDQIAVRISEATVDTRDPDKILAPLRAIATLGDEAASSFMLGTTTTTTSGSVSSSNSHETIAAAAAGSSIKRHDTHSQKWSGPGLASLRGRSALALAVFKTYFSGPEKRLQGVVAALGAAVEDGRKRQRGLGQGI